MELAAGGVNKAQTHFTLYAVPSYTDVIDFIPNLTTSTCKNEAENTLASFILWLLKVTELHPPPLQKKIRKHSTAKE